MKRAKFIFRIDENLRGKVYIGKKWLKDVYRIKIDGEPNNYTVTVWKYKKNEKGLYYTVDNEIAKEVKVYCLKNG